MEMARDREPLRLTEVEGTCDEGIRLVSCLIKRWRGRLGEEVEGDAMVHEITVILAAPLPKGASSLDFNGPTDIISFLREEEEWRMNSRNDNFTRTKVIIN